MSILKLRCKGCGKEMVPKRVEAGKMQLMIGKVKVYTENAVFGGPGNQVEIHGTLEDLKRHFSNGIQAQCSQCGALYSYKPDEYCV